ncbi:MAG TPA: hypothetical protein DDW52_13265 [Planctomycetaceae bacterium]|nr:hypothetical protein [Planctomycetaceae bacterium]
MADRDLAMNALQAREHVTRIAALKMLETEFELSHDILFPICRELYFHDPHPMVRGYASHTKSKLRQMG